MMAQQPKNQGLDDDIEDDDQDVVVIEDDDEEQSTDDDSAGTDDDESQDEPSDASDNQESDDETSLEDNETVEEKRERRRLERIARREHRKEKEEQNRRELRMLRKEREELANRLAVLERKTTGSEIAQIDSAIEDTVRIAEALKQDIRTATEANDGVAMAEATDRYYKVQRRHEDLQRLKQAHTQGNRQQETRSPIDPTLRRHAESWMSKNSWYDPQGGDADSRVALAIDASLGQEGWDPRTEEYWEELSERLSKYLPHRTQKRNTQQRQQRTQPKQTTTGSGRDGNKGGGRENAFKLSPERVSAMKDAGIWEDVEARNKMIAKYRAFDKEAANERK
jgi:hypothetical protein